jgi:sortase A
MWNVKKSSDHGGEVSGCECESSRRGWVIWKWTEKAIFTVGLSLLAIYGAFRLESYLGSRTAMRSFSALESSASAAAGDQGEDNLSPETSSAQEIDFSAWDENRVRAYKESLSNQTGAPIAVLKIPKIHLAVPLLDGTDALTLNHAVGRIAGTALPGEQGNIGIAGHRDGFFRGLKDVALGDVIELRNVNETNIYVVDQIEIVKPDNVSVLRPRTVPSLTLVTCYPFFFVGSAPKRFVVTASLKQPQPAEPTKSETRPSTQTSSSTMEEQ